ncbi:MAG: MFS transporter [Actinomycetota bacterium]|nr:MFS transporter [Actinomycetota bacterium]
MTAGISVASTYYLQPIYSSIASTFHVTSSDVSVGTAVTQVGYALGLIFLVPLGDMVNRRRLITGMIITASCALAATALSPNLTMLFVGAFLIGVTGVVTQMTIGLVASLAPDGDRASAVSVAMSGLLAGVLLARTVSGIMALYLGWRTLFALAAFAMVILSIFAVKRIPSQIVSPDLSYGALLASLITTLKSSHSLRVACSLGFFQFMTFSIFWNTSALWLGEHFHLNSLQIGLIALVGLAGTFSSRIAGSLSDRGYRFYVSWVGIALIAISYLLLAVGKFHLITFVLAAVVLDFGVQGSHLANQAAIYSVMPEARSRVTGVYMTSYFAGGSIGSVVSTIFYTHFGYTSIPWLGFIAGTSGLVIRFVFKREAIRA